MNNKIYMHVAVHVTDCADGVLAIVYLTAILDIFVSDIFLFNPYLMFPLFLCSCFLEMLLKL